MEVTMKEAFDNYFERLNKLWMDKTGYLPQVPRNDKLVQSGLYIENTENQYGKGYVAWQPQLQNEKVEFNLIEDSIGYTIAKSVKQFFSTYWFETINIQIANIPEFNLWNIDKTISNEIPYNEFWIEGIVPNNTAIEKFKISLLIGDIDQIRFLNRKFAHIGNGCVNGDDSFTLLIDIVSGEVFAVESEDKFVVKVAENIKELIMNSEVTR
jgi:hypothetical protein